jgi:hypothetical protein
MEEKGMQLTVGELREIIEEADDDIVVVFASQPSYPMEYTVSQAEIVYNEGDDEDQDPIGPRDTQGAKLVLVEGEQSYMGGQTRRAIGW